MEEEPTEAGQAPSRRRSRTAKVTQNGGSPNSERPSAKGSVAVESKTEFEPGQPEQPEGPDGPPLGLARPALSDDEDDEAPQGLLTAAQLAKPVHLSTARYRIARAGMVILGFIVLATFVSINRSKPSIDDITRLLEIIFAPVVALVGVALAFYYRGSS